MARSNYSAAFKAQIVLAVIREESSLEGIAAENNLNPNMVRNWKAEFMANAGSVFDSKAGKEMRQKEAALKKERTQMLKTIGQLTLERDFLQDCFRKAGRSVELPNFHTEDI